MSRWTITIPAWRPARLNQMKGHWSNGARLKKKDRELVFLEALRQRVPKATQKRRVSLDITYSKRERQADSDAFWKSLLDALVQAGQLVDDRPDYCDLGTVEQKRGETTQTVIILEDV